MSFEAIEKTFSRQAENTAGISFGRSRHDNEKKSVCNSTSFLAPSAHFIRDIFMHDFRLKRLQYEAFLQDADPTLLSLDHTFQIRYTKKHAHWDNFLV
jgi:hypothetical protein